jgi:mannose-P-dolichol utilization defect protein 1
MLAVCFSAWGEGFFLAVQTAIIGALVPFFGRSAKEALLFIVSYLAVCFILMGGYTSVSVLWSLQALNVPIICVSKVRGFFCFFWKNEITL